MGTSRAFDIRRCSAFAFGLWGWGFGWIDKFRTRFIMIYSEQAKSGNFIMFKFKEDALFLPDYQLCLRHRGLIAVMWKPALAGLRRD